MTGDSTNRLDNSKKRGPGALASAVAVERAGGRRERRAEHERQELADG
jgi:hypothetical protein